MYEVKATGEKFNSFTKAVAAAVVIRSEVFEVETGVRRWAPAPEVSAKRMHRYREQAAAYAAQQAGDGAL